MDQKNVGLFTRKILKKHTKMQKVKLKSKYSWHGIEKILDIDKLRNQKIDNIPIYKLLFLEKLLYRKRQNQNWMTYTDKIKMKSYLVI